MIDRKNGSIEKKYWLEQPSNIRIIVWSLASVCVMLFFADALYHKHAHFEIEGLFGFYGVYGFSVCVALVLIAKALRPILMRAEGYYDRQEDARPRSDVSGHGHD